MVPAVNPWLFRVLRASAVAVIAWLLYQVLAHYEREWLFVPIALVVFVLWLAEQARALYARRKKEADWDRWEGAVAGPPADRSLAIREVREALRRSVRFGPRLRQEQAHLSVILAELLDAAGQPGEATKVLARVDLDALTPSQAVVVRHARVVAYLSAGMIDDADVVLAVRAKDSGEPDMDARLDLLAGMIAIERGDPERALEIADEVDARLPDDASLHDESTVVRAAAYDARSDRARAIEAMRTLDAETLEALAQLGPARIRPLAAAAREPDPAALPTAE
jgi:outer membrane PBP1 activator LpoA protein